MSPYLLFKSYYYYYLKVGHLLFTKLVHIIRADDAPLAYVLICNSIKKMINSQIAGTNIMYTYSARTQ